MPPAFAAPALLAPAARPSFREPRRTARPRFAMVSVSRPQTKRYFVDEAMESQVTAAPPAPEVAAVAAAVCDFMNTERVRDIASYIVRFGKNFDDLGQLTAVKITGLDAAGFTADVVSCDDTSHCVCVQERLEWPLGLCHNAADIIAAFKHLSMLCGLPADF